MSTEKIKAILYARVSSKKQEEGFSIPAQLELLRDYAVKKEIEIVEEFVEAESAKQTGRTKFNEMLKYLKKHKNITNILVEKTDRLYRNFNDYVTIDESVYSVHLVKENKVLTPNSSSSEKLEHVMKVMIAKNYIDNLREETQKGRRIKAQEGYFIGQVPYGYKKLDDKKTTIPHPQHSLFVKRAFELFAQGNISLRAVVKRMYNEGYLYLPSSDKISVSQLEKMLKNECYIGFVKHNGELIKGKHKALVSDIMFRKVQIAFKKDNKPDKCTKHTYLYSRMMTCGVCKRTITSEMKRGRIIYYHCTGDYGKCANKSIYVPEEVIDKQINEAIKAVTIDESLAQYLNNLLNKSYTEMKIMTAEKADYIKREISSIKNRQEKLLDALLDGAIPRDLYTKKQAECDEKIEHLKQQLRANNMTNEKFINQGKNFIGQSKALYSLYLAQNTEEKRKMLKIVFSNLWLEGEIVHYEYNRPFCYFAEMNKNKKKLLRLDSNQQPTG